MESNKLLTCGRYCSTLTLPAPYILVVINHVTYILIDEKSD